MLKASGIDLDAVVDVVSVHRGIDTAELSGPYRREPICQIGVALESDSDQPLPTFIKPTERRQN